ncbi:hypothetical protein GTP45_07000 [Pseudoduganella sp. FT55W]|uniref:Uncharacterized protein n=1 Tax=Duganella rivi TaxID=2666083 RepID=A0A7X4GP89_9BURK|nr:hypothetical protein [Duganella rivi]MYM66586.1 hypothetical protein [Duganella rivi]
MNTNSDREYIDGKVNDLRSTTGERFEGVRMQHEGINATLKALDLKIDSVVEAAKAEIIKWLAGLLVAMITMFIATFLGMASLMVNLLSHQPSAVLPAAASISTPAVIIQLTPQGTTVLPAAPPAGKP